MATIIERRAWTQYTEESIWFQSIGETGCGFSFNCDKDGNPVFEEGTCQRESYEWCISHQDLYEKPFRRTQTFNRLHPARAICECGKEIYISDGYMGADECPYCGRWHNTNGQLLKNPMYWEE